MKTNFKKIVLVAVFLVALVSVVAVALFVADFAENSGDNIPDDESNSANTMNAIYIDGEKYYPRVSVLNYLIIGVDKFEDQEKRGQSDFIMILSVDRDAGTYKLISINRDTMVEVDHYDTNGKKGDTKVEQIALSHAYGKKDEISNKQKCENTELSVSRIFMGMKFDGYISMTMDAVCEMVDEIGGVEVLIKDDMKIVDERLVQGETVLLDGDLALKFVRARTGVGEGKNPERMERQKDFLKAFFAKLEGQSLNTSIIELYDEISSMLVSDSEDTYLEIFEKLSSYDNAGFVSPEGEYTMGQTYWEFNVSKDSIEEILKSIFYEKAD